MTSYRYNTPCDLCSGIPMSPQCTNAELLQIEASHDLLTPPSGIIDHLRRNDTGSGSTDVLGVAHSPPLVTLGPICHSLLTSVGVNTVRCCPLVVIFYNAPCLNLNNRAMTGGWEKKA